MHGEECKMKNKKLIKLNLALTIVLFLLYILLIYYVSEIARFKLISSFFLAMGTVIFTLIFFLYVIWKIWKFDYLIFNKRSTIIVASITFLIFSFPIAYIILEFGRELAKSGSVQIGSADGWLGFIGAVFGGFITLLAIIFTLGKDKDENKDRIPKSHKRTSRPNTRMNKQRRIKKTHCCGGRKRLLDKMENK